MTQQAAFPATTIFMAKENFSNMRGKINKLFPVLFFFFLLFFTTTPIPPFFSIIYNLNHIKRKRE